jgi:type I restriction enzyme M protein
MLIKGKKEAEIFLGNSLIPHGLQGTKLGEQLSESRYRFDYLLSNPPFGVTWVARTATKPRHAS